jgi:hypothetical protein
VFESISLKFTELAEPLRVPTQGVTIFVGPNNSGKSLVLREVEQSISSYGPIATKIVDNFEIVWIGEQQLEDDLAQLMSGFPQSADPELIIKRFVPNGNIDAVTVPVGSIRDNMKSHRQMRWLQDKTSVAKVVTASCVVKAVADSKRVMITAPRDVCEFLEEPARYHGGTISVEVVMSIRQRMERERAVAEKGSRQHRRARVTAMAEYEFHPLADLFPLLGEAELNELADDAMAR